MNVNDLQEKLSEIEGITPEHDARIKQLRTMGNDFPELIDPILFLLEINKAGMIEEIENRNEPDLIKKHAGNHTMPIAGIIAIIPTLLVASVDSSDLLYWTMLVYVFSLVFINYVFIKSIIFIRNV